MRRAADTVNKVEKQRKKWCDISGIKNEAINALSVESQDDDPRQRGGMRRKGRPCGGLYSAFSGRELRPSPLFTLHADLRLFMREMRWHFRDYPIDAR